MCARAWAHPFLFSLGMKLKSLLISCLSLVSFAAVAQTQQVSGIVVDERGLPMEMVSVYVKGTANVVPTDTYGKYSIEATPKDTLLFTFLGYLKQEIIVGKRKNIDVALRPSNDFRLTDLVVTGYGRQERRDLTGSVSSVKPDDRLGFQSVDQLLQGKAPGVYMTNSSGALGSANLLTIRGVSSIMGDNTPLYVIDGVPVYSTDRDANSMDVSGGSVPGIAMGGTQIGGGSLKYNYDLRYSFEKNPLATLNPDDIESIEILKDAFATAIYGSRGAAGVILITTKKGSRDRVQVNVGYTTSIDNPLGKLELLNGDEYSDVYNRYYKMGYPRLTNTDWVDAVTRTAVSHSTNASVSGGIGKTTYFASLSYDDNESYVINNDMQRYAARMNLNTAINDCLNMGMNMSVTKLYNNALSASSIYALALKKAPNLPIWDDKTGDYYYGYSPNAKGDSEAFNPVAMAYINNEGLEDTRVVGNGFLEYKPANWISLRSEIGIDNYNSFTSIRKGALPETLSGSIGNQATESTALKNKMVINNLININKSFGDQFILGVIGQSYEYSQERSMSVAGSDFFSPDLNGVGAAQSKRVTGASMRQYALFSAFARLNYQMKQRYLAGVTYRLDGSSRFNRNHRYLSTPSFSLGWRLSEENFIKNNTDLFSELKLRGSVGLSSKDGNNSYYGAQAVYNLNTLTSYGGYNYLQMSQPGNENLDWERTITYDAGLDMEMFEGRVKMTLDYYYKMTTNMLFASDLPLYTGYTKENQNIADMMNQGIDLQFITTNIQTNDFQWQTIVNLSRSTNKILKLKFEGNQLDNANSSYKYYAEGAPVAQWYLHEWVGVDPMTGDPLWKYADGTISHVAPESNYATSQANKFVKGTALPDLYGSLNNSLFYKNFELNFMFTFALGSRMMNSTRATLLTYTNTDANNLGKEVLSMWQIPGQETDIPKLNNSSIVNGYDYTTAITTTRFLEDNSYLRLKNVTLTYNVPQRLLIRTKTFKQLSVFATFTNLLTFTKYSGLDPEVSAFGSSAIGAGYDNSTMPQSRSCQFGIRASF